MNTSQCAVYHRIPFRDAGVQQDAGSRLSSNDAGIGRLYNRNFLSYIPVLHKFVSDAQEKKGIRTLQHTGNG